MLRVAYPPLRDYDMKGVPAVYIHNKCKNLPTEMKTMWKQDEIVGLHKQFLQELQI